MKIKNKVLELIGLNLGSNPTSFPLEEKYRWLIQETNEQDLHKQLS